MYLTTSKRDIAFICRLISGFVILPLIVVSGCWTMYRTSVNWTEIVFLMFAAFIVWAFSRILDAAADAHLRKVKALTNQQILATIAQSDKDLRARQAAAEMLSNQAGLAQVVYAEVVKRAADEDLRMAAVEHLVDQSDLTEIAKNEKQYLDVRRAALKKIIDQAVIEDIAQNAGEMWVRYAAVERLTNQSLLTKIEDSDRDDMVRSAAVSKLTDSTLLTRIIKTDVSVIVRASAAENPNIVDEDLLASIAMNKEEDEFVRESVCKNPNLKDEALLSYLAENMMLEAARERLADLAENATPEAARERRIVKRAQQRHADLEDEFFDLMQQQALEMRGSGHSIPEVARLATDKAADILMKKYGLTRPKMEQIIEKAVRKNR